MTRHGRRKTGGNRTGLWRWGPNGEQPDEVQDNPLLRPCGFCGAPVRQPCRRPSRGGWTNLIGRFHEGRTAPPVINADQPETGPQAPA